MKIKKAVLTGGGRATRLFPITSTINKHLLPLANKPMIFHAIEKVIEAGIEEIFINTNPGEKELQQVVGDGARWGIKITFFEQTGGPLGIAHVVNEAEKFIGDDPFMFYLSDNILLGGVKEMIGDFSKGEHDCMLALSEVEDARSFGVPVFALDGSIVEVLEKPDSPPNNKAVTGIYLYGSAVFFEAFKKINKSGRGEYEISDLHTILIKDGKKVGYKEITGWWKDTGKPNDLLIANQLLLENKPVAEYRDAVGNISNEKVHIGGGTRIGSNVVLCGPVVIGENCNLEDCTIGPNVAVGVGCKIIKAKLENCLLLDAVTVDCPIYIKDSIVGKGASILGGQAQMSYPKKIIIGDKTLLEL